MSMDDIHEDRDLSDFLAMLIDMGHLEGAALGVAKQVIDKGQDSLSEKQAYVFHEHVLKQNTTDACSRCGSDIPWSEMYDATFDHGYCNYCWHMITKDD